MQAVQALVSGVRTEAGLPIVRDYMGDIGGIIDNVVSLTTTAFVETRSASLRAALRERGQPVLDKLSDCRTQLVSANAEAERINDAASFKAYINRLPPLAFEVARETKVGFASRRSPSSASLWFFFFPSPFLSLSSLLPSLLSLSLSLPLLSVSQSPQEGEERVCTRDGGSVAGVTTASNTTITPWSSSDPYVRVSLGCSLPIVAAVVRHRHRRHCCHCHQLTQTFFSVDRRNSSSVSKRSI